MSLPRFVGITTTHIWKKCKNVISVPKIDPRLRSFEVKFADKVPLTLNIVPKRREGEETETNHMGHFSHGSHVYTVHLESVELPYFLLWEFSVIQIHEFITSSVGITKIDWEKSVKMIFFKSKWLPFCATRPKFCTALRDQARCVCKISSRSLQN